MPRRATRKLRALNLPSLPPSQPPPSPPPSPPPGAARWQLRLLGAVELRDGSGNVTRLASRAVVLLLARLALGAGRDHAREEVIDLLWPEAPLDVGRNRLRQTLAVLRSVLEPPGLTSAPVLLADRRTLRLVPGSVECDVESFEAALQRGDAAAAARWYGGELLPGFYDEWVHAHRLRLAASADELKPVARCPVRQPVSAPPRWPPVVPPQLVAVALRQHRLPLYLTRLVGFEAAGAALAAAVKQQRLVILRGPGGAGKTRLAVEVARALAQGDAWSATATATATEPFDTIAFVPLAACEDRAVFHDAVLLALQRDAAAAPAQDATDRLESALAGRHALLVLDNFEQLVDVARQDLSTWLARLPGLHLLVTSRRALGLDGEVEQALAALPLPSSGAPLNTSALNPAVALFVDRAQAVRADFHLGERNQALVVAVVRQLQGLPLALELAAARLRSVSLADMLDMLRGAAQGEPGRGLVLLARSGPRAADDPRHASMLRVVDWSWQHLDAAARQRLTQLAAFDGGATLHTMHNMLGGSLEQAAVGLDDLVAASVAFVQEGPTGGVRYHTFEPMREYALALLGAADRAGLRRQHLEALLLWARALGRSPALDSFRDELPNLLAAQATAVACGEPALAVQLALDCAAALVDVPLPPSGLDTLRRALTSLADGVSGEPTAISGTVQRLAAAGHALLAHLSFDAGQRDAAQLHAQQALQLAPEGSVERAAVLYAAARVQLRVHNDAEAAAALAAQALQLARAHGLLHVQAQALVLQAVLAVRVAHDMPRDVALKQEALGLWRQLGSPARLAAAQVGLAISMGFMRRFPEQLELLDQGSRAAATNGQRTLWAFAQSVQGYLLADLRRFGPSAGCYLGCLRTAWDIGSWREWFYALWNLPRTLAHGRRPQAAARLMGFADAFYTQRFGTLGWEDARERRRTRRLVLVQLGAAHEAALWQEGARLSMAQAMELGCAEAQRMAEPAPACAPKPAP